MASAIRFINHQPHSQFAVVPVVNYSTPLHDLYHQIPQLNSYQTFKPSLFQSTYQFAGAPQENSPIHLVSSNLNLHPGGNQRPKLLSRKDEETINRLHSSDGAQKLNHRDGWGGYGQGGGPGYGKGGSIGQSPAISALALLGFLFFLNLIQTSLQNNRNMLTTVTTTTTTTNTSMSNSMTTGSSGSSTTTGRNGRVRKRRGISFEELRLTPESIPTHPNRQVQDFLQNKDEDVVKRLLPRQGHSSRGYEDHFSLRTKNIMPNRQTSNQASHIPPKIERRKSNILSKFKRLSVNCVKLLACNMGRSLFSEIGPTAGFMMRMIGDKFLPNSPKHDWKSQIFRALTFGWRTQRKCNQIYTQCALGKGNSRPQKASGNGIRMNRRFQRLQHSKR